MNETVGWDQWVLNRTREQLRTHNVPAVPGTAMADDLADLLGQLDRLTTDRRELGANIAELTAKRRSNGATNKRLMADAFRGGGDVADAPSVQALDDAIAVKRQRGDAIALAEDEVRADIRRLVKANAIPWRAEMANRTRTQRLAVEDAIDRLEAEWAALGTVEAAIGWIDRGGKGNPVVSAPVLKVPRDPNLGHVLASMRSVVAEKPAPRPTVDDDGTPRTGWAAYGQLVNGKRAIGDLRQRPANDAMRAKHAADAKAPV